jgi:hypothetical protein
LAKHPNQQSRFFRRWKCAISNTTVDGDLLTEANKNGKLYEFSKTGYPIYGVTLQ